MDARELRRGNLITKDARIFEVIGLTPTDGIQVAVFQGYMSTHVHSADEFKGVHITAEWLERMGFVERGGSWSYHIHFRIRLNIIGMAVEVILDNHYWGMVEYVHKLQNLYFDLTDQELTPKM